MNKVEFKNVTLSYGKNTIVRDFSLSIMEREIVGIIGPSGCGKTTIARALCGLMNPDSGEIYMDGQPVFSRSQRVNIPPEKRGIGIVFQDYAVWPHMSVFDNIAYPLKKQGASKEEIAVRVHDALEQVDLKGYDRYMPSQLSGGQQQRVAIARALTASRDLVVMDEPITNLDAKLRASMLVEIRLMQQRLGTTIIYITHDQGAALQLCDRIVLLNAQGDVVQVGADEDLIEKPASRYVFSFMGISNFIPVKEADGQYCLELDHLIPFSKTRPEGWIDGPAEMGVRPMDMVISPDGLVPARVTQATFLGNMYNYFVEIGGHEYRLQRSTLDSLNDRDYAVGEDVRVKFVNERYYPRKEAEE